MTGLRAELDAALRTITPGQAPVEAAMRRGRRLRLRRRLGAVAGVTAVAVGAAAGYPALAHRSAAARPVPPVHQQRVVVTDKPPGKGAPPGEIAAGAVGGVSWEVDVDKPAVKAPGAPPACWRSWQTGAPEQGAFSSSLKSAGCDLPKLTGQWPVSLTGQQAGTNAVMIGAVRPAVTYVLLTLADGQQLKLIPVTSYGGARLLAYVAPLRDPVIKAAAYLGNGQYLTAVPFNQPGSLPSFGLWLRPGDAAPPTASAVLTAGTPGVWSGKVSAYEGPWGTCFSTGPGESECRPARRLLATEVSGLAGGDPPVMVWGSASPYVTRLEVTLTNGDTLRVPAVPVGDENLWAFGVAKGQRVKSLAAYDAAGTRTWTAAMPR
jgi:hypothetical protein